MQMGDEEEQARAEEMEDRYQQIMASRAERMAGMRKPSVTIGNLVICDDGSAWHLKDRYDAYRKHVGIAWEEREPIPGSVRAMERANEVETTERAH